ncbi:hypothetical protein [Streptomyces purpureus]|uniref:Uncharacterized protein n=1 Tax=Streptomyces purpureus TaxID=1951 RepID=A0A918HIG5_9ACTN|nr:hypothetical protein [Streptomyces purpureus]GGT63404.1 hypothetical protein GCM10014713_65860 [Streptomyces purpureus]
MADAAYPHLGWNPAPGSPTEIAALRSKLSASATSLGTAHRLVAELLGESAYWRGEAADAFRAALDGDLPRYLKNAHRSLSKAASRLGTWHDDLVGYQATARRYETRAALESAALRKAESTASTARTTPNLPAADLAAATDAVTKARTALANVRRLARELEETHRAEAERVAKSLDEATDRLAPVEPGRLSRVLDWVDENLGDGLSTLSALVGLAAVVATGGAIVPLLFIAAGLSLAALVVHARDPKIRSAITAGFTEGRFDGKFWGATVTLAGDAIGSLPGIGAVAHGAKGVAGAVRAGAAAEEGVSVGVRGGLRTFASDSKEGMRHINSAPKPLVEWTARRTGVSAERPISAGVATVGVGASGTGLLASEDDDRARNAATATDAARLAGWESTNISSAARTWAQLGR